MHSAQCTVHSFSQVSLLAPASLLSPEFHVLSSVELVPLCDEVQRALDEALVLLGLIFKLIAYKSNMFAMSHSALSRCFPSSIATNLYKIAVPQITSINGTKLEI